MSHRFRALIASLVAGSILVAAAPAYAHSEHAPGDRAPTDRVPTERSCRDRTRCRPDGVATADRPFRPELPEPTGPYEIGRTALHLVDRDRRDPWVPTRRRELMATVTYPARHADHHPRARWFSPPVAADLVAIAAEPPLSIAPGSLDLAGPRAHAHTGAPLARPGSHHRGRDWPVVLFSPGFGTSREYNTALVEDVASQGYVVVSFDHTYEAPVEFPGGRVVPPAPETLSTDLAALPSVFRRAIDARVADTLFVLDELVDLDRGRNPDAEHRRLPAGLRRGLDLSRIGVFGYSYGGYTAAEAMHRDRRIDAGVNLDGAMAHGFGLTEDWPYLPGAAVTNGLDRPFLLFGNDAHNHLVAPPGAPGDLSWPEFWANQRGWKLDLTLRGSQHGSFSDGQVLVAQAQQALDVPADAVEPLIGTVDADRSLASQRAYIAAFFDLHLRGRDTHLLDGPSRRHPDVVFQPD